MNDKNDKRAEFLEIINQYEKCNREVLAHRVQMLLASLHLSVAKECRWLSENVADNEYAYDTLRSWFAPNRDAKMPLKFVLKVALYFDISIEGLLKEQDKKVDLRFHNVRTNNCERWVAEYMKEHPEASIEDVAADLRIAENTVRRHLKHLDIPAVAKKSQIAARKKDGMEL